MGSNWEEYLLKDVGTIVTGKTPPRTLAKYFGGSAIFVTPTDMSEEKQITRTARTLSSEGVLIQSKIMFERAIIVSCIGWQMGKTAVVNQLACTNQQINSIIVNEAIVNFDFLYYTLKHKRREIFNLGATATRTPILKKSLFEKISFRAPLLREQQSIAHVLGTLDNKIELNRRMNETLESMARTLFKSWFVDFDPVIDNALAAGNPIPEPLQARAETRLALGPARQPLPPNIQKLFPAAFQFDEEMGWIPSDWKREPLGGHVQLQRGKTYKSRLKGEPGPYLLGLGAIGRNGGFRSDKLKTYGGDCPENLLVYPGDLFVSLKDVTQAADLLGAVARVPTSIKVGRMTQDTVKLVFNDNAVSGNILYRLLMTPRYRDFCRSHATGTTNLGLAREDFLGYPVIVPSADVQTKFDNFMADTEKRIDRNEGESNSLAKLRDTLLPQLLSGELRIPDAEKLVADSL